MLGKKIAILSVVTIAAAALAAEPAAAGVGGCYRLPSCRPEATSAPVEPFAKERPGKPVFDALAWILPAEANAFLRGLTLFNEKGEKPVKGPSIGTEGVGGCYGLFGVGGCKQ